MAVVEAVVMVAVARATWNGKLDLFQRADKQRAAAAAAAMMVQSNG